MRKKRKYNRPEVPERQRVIDMTICIAALCEDAQSIVCATDRMVTSGDIEFESIPSKFVELTDSICLLIAGNTQMQAEICQKLHDGVSSKSNISVQEAAKLYVEYYNKVRLEKAEQEILAPRGMNYEFYINKQKEINSTIVENIDSQFENYYPDYLDVETIVAGYDSCKDAKRAHLYIISNGDIMCNDYSGFAAIGSGYWHVNSQFMMSRHNFYSPLIDTILLTYLAKKQSEVTPGVGRETHMNFYKIKSGESSLFHFEEELYNLLESFHQNIIDAEKSAKKKSLKEIKKILGEKWLE